jgi:hypothetical protein
VELLSICIPNYDFGTNLVKRLEVIKFLKKIGIGKTSGSPILGPQKACLMWRVMAASIKNFLLIMGSIFFILLIC